MKDYRYRRRLFQTPQAALQSKSPDIAPYLQLANEVRKRGLLLNVRLSNWCQETSGCDKQPKGQEDHPDSPTDGEGLNYGLQNHHSFIPP